jgi:hypothetical protein
MHKGYWVFFQRKSPTIKLYLSQISINIFLSKSYFLGAVVAQSVALQIGRSRVRFPMVSLEFFIDITLSAALWPWVDSASNRNEYQEYFLGVKSAGA